MGGSSPNSDFFFFLNVVFWCLLWFNFVIHVSKTNIKKMDRGVSGWNLANPSFSRIFGFFLT